MMRNGFIPLTTNISPLDVSSSMSMITYSGIFVKILPNNNEGINEKPKDGFT